MTARTVFIAALTAAALATVGCSSSSDDLGDATASESRELTGVINVEIPPEEAADLNTSSGGKLEKFVDAPCDGSTIAKGFGDIDAGAGVVVKDESGTTVAMGEVDGGTGYLGGCALPFKVDDVPDAKFYEIQVADRNPVRYSAAELAGDDWHLELTLTSD